MKASNAREKAQAIWFYRHYGSKRRGAASRA